jgi:hypothetical protein
VKAVFGRLDQAMNELELINYLIQRKYPNDISPISSTMSSKDISLKVIILLLHPSDK